MSRWSLLGVLSAVVVALAVIVLLLGRAAWQARQPVGCEDEPSGRAPDAKPLGPIHIFIDQATKADEDQPPTGKQLLTDIEGEIGRIDQRLSELIESLRSATEQDRRKTLIGIRDEIETIAGHLAPPITVQGIPGGTPVGATYNLNVRHHIESVNEDVLTSIREILEPMAITVNVRGDGPGLGCRLVELAPVMAFPIAGHELKTETETCEKVAANFWEQLDGRRLSHLVLVGRADRMPFGDARYGGNRGLAQARASWVHECLRRNPPGTEAKHPAGHILDVLENRTMLLSAGPLHVPACRADADCDPDGRARDRGVDLFACLDEPTPQAVEPAADDARTGSGIHEGA